MGRTGKASGAALADSPSHLLHRALQLALDLYASEASGLVTQRQFAVLSAVAADEGLSQTDLVRTTGIDRSTLADLIARMIAKGLLDRARSEVDGRAKTVRLTAVGREALAAAEPRAAAADLRLMELLGRRKGEKFIALLQSLLAAGIEGPDEDEEPKAAKKAKGKDKKAKKKARKAAALVVEPAPVE